MSASEKGQRARVDQIVADLVADSHITSEDAAQVLVFAQYLAEVPLGMVASRGRDWPSFFPNQGAWEDWRAKWLPYVMGIADGPSTPEEWPQHRERIRIMQRRTS